MGTGIILAMIFIVCFSLIVTPALYFLSKWLAGNKWVAKHLDKILFGG